jgi:ferric-dicitrate binding protein FerR (iron transport regulator)
LTLRRAFSNKDAALPRNELMKRNSPAVLFLACFLTAALVLPSDMLARRGGLALADTAGQRAGQIDRMIPVVGITRGKQNINAAAKTIVNWEDVVNTQAGARARIVLDDGSILNVGSKSSLRVVKHDAGGQQTELELTYGKLRSQAAKITKPGGKFEVRTPAGVAGVVGTDYFVSFLNSLMMVIVYVDIARVCNLANVCVDVVAGQFTSVRAGDNSPPLPPAAVVDSAKFIHTDDWQRGDHVSLGVQGFVTPEEETGDETEGTEADATGYLVALTDSEGRTTQVPWSPGVKYNVQAVGGVITARLTKPDKTVVATATIPVHLPGAYPSCRMMEASKGNSVASPISQTGQTFTVFSPTSKFDPNTGPLTLRVRNEADQSISEYKPLAQSPRSAVFMPRDAACGRSTFTVSKAGEFEESFTVYRLCVALDTSRVYPRGKKGTLRVMARGFPENEKELASLTRDLSMYVTNETPDTLAFSNEPNQITWRIQAGEVNQGNWQRDISVVALHAGPFRDTARLSAPICTNPK